LKGKYKSTGGFGRQMQDD